MSKVVRIGMLVLALAGNGLSPAAASGSPLRAAGAKKLLANPPVADGELAAIRGGFFTVAGAQFDFGATVTTTINGQLALQTNLTWTPGGAAIQQLSGLGAAIQSQVAANLAKAGIADPVAATTAASVQTAPTTTPAATSVAPAPAATVQTVPMTNTAAPSVAAPTATVQTVPMTTTAAPSVAPAAASAAATSAASAAASLPQTSLASVGAPATTAGTPASVTPTTTAPVVSAAAPASATAVTPAPAASPTPTTVATITNIVPSSSTSGSSAAPTILTGVQLQSATGTTQVLTNIGANQLQNILINSASNQQIVQNTNLIFTIYNFADWQKQLSQNAISAQLANEIMGAAGLGGSR